MTTQAFSVFFFATETTPHRGLPGQFPCFLDAIRAARQVAPKAAFSSMRGPRHDIFASSEVDAPRISEIVADHELLARQVTPCSCFRLRSEAPWKTGRLVRKRSYLHV